MTWLKFLLVFLVVSHQSFSQETFSDTTTGQTQEVIQDAAYFKLLAKRTISPSSSLKYLYKALALRTAGHDDNWEAALRVNIAASLFKIGETQQAVSQLLTAEKLYRLTGNLSAQGEVFSQVADFYLRNEAWTDAEKNYKTALALQQSAGEQRLAAKASLLLAEIAIHNGNLSTAVKRLNYSKAQYESSEDKNGIGNTYVKLSEVYRLQKNYAKAEQLIIKSTLPLFRSTGYLAGKVECFDALGRIYRSQNRSSEAKWFFIQANTQARAINDQEGIILSLINLGKVKVNIGDYNLARKDFKEAEMLAEKRNDLFLLALVKNAYAGLYKREGNKNGAVNASKRSEDLTDSLNNYFSAQTELAKIAKVEPKPLVKSAVKLNIPEPENTDIFLLIKNIALAIVIFISILLFLKKIK